LGMASGDLVHGKHETRRLDQCVFSLCHRRRATVAFLPLDSRIIPTHALHTQDNADRPSFGFEKRSLFDMELKHSLEFYGARLELASVADRIERLRKISAVGCLSAIGKRAVEHTNMDARAEHWRCEARSLLVRPVYNHQRAVGLAIGVLQRPQELESGKNPENAVKLSARRLGVEMTAHGDWVCRWIDARVKCKHISDLIHRNFATKFIAAFRKPIANPAVLLRQGKPGDPAVLSTANRGRLH